MKYIVIVECTDAGGIEIGMAVLQMGYRPLFLLNPESYKADVGLSLQNFEFKHVNTESVSSIINALKPIQHTIAAIGTMVDGRIKITAEVAKIMDISGPDAACILLKDKVNVANLCKDFSLATVALSSNIDECKALIREHYEESEVVAKKRHGFGAIGVEFLRTLEEKYDFLAKTTDLQNWLLQEYFAGKLYSMEGWVENSNVNFLGWTSRKKTEKTETEFRFEGYNTISLALTEQAQKAIYQLISKSGLTRGWFHIEFLIDFNNQQLKMIDANVGRVGGAMLPHVLAQVFSKTPAEIYQHALEIQIFGTTNVDLQLNQDLQKIYKCICFGSPFETIIQEVILPKYPLQTFGLRIVRILGSGDFVTKMGHDDLSWIGIVAGEEIAVENYVSQIRIKTQKNIYNVAY